jgi:RHS repeat-associated protein
LISRRNGSDASYYIYDGGLSVRALTNEAGTVTDTLVFDAFGNETAKTGSTDNAYGFQGEEKDETGLYYLRARYMDPSTGTFTSMDTYGGSLSDPMSLHKYMFANSNPVAYCDPGGHEASLQGMVTAMAISGILSAVDSGILYSLQNKDSDIEKYGKSVYGWNVATAAMNGFLIGFILGIFGYALCQLIAFRIILSAIGLCIGIPFISSGIDEVNSSNGNKALGAYTIAKGVIITIVSTVGLVKSGAEFFEKYGKGGNLIHLEGDPNIEGDGDWGDINKEIDDWYNSNGPSKNIPPHIIEGTSYDISKLVKTQGNINETQVKLIADSIKANGPDSMPPIKVLVHDGTAYIVDGHHRYEAYKRLGYQRVPIKYIHKYSLGNEAASGRSLNDILTGAELWGG